MAVQDFTGKNIQDTYQRVVQTDGTNLADGTGSLLPISFNGNNVIISGSLSAIEYTVTSSVTNVIFQQQSGSTIFGDSQDDTHLFTGSLKVTGSILADEYQLQIGANNEKIIQHVGNHILFGAINNGTSSPYPTTISGSNIRFNSDGDIICDIGGGDFRLNKSATEYFRFNLDDEIADIDVAGDLRLDPGGGDVLVDGNVTASGNIIANNALISGVISSSHSGGSNNVFGAGVDIHQELNMKSTNELKLQGGTESATNPFTSSLITNFGPRMTVFLDASGLSDDEVFEIRKNNPFYTLATPIFSIDSEGSISQSANITASGDISASGNLIGIINGGTF